MIKKEINGNILEITPIGAGNEVGRSCVNLKYKGKNILFDCGIHPAYHGIYALPYFDSIDPGDIDLLLVTHFHIDHCGALPYFLRRTDFKGKVVMTHPTKAIYNYVLLDYVKISNIGNGDILYDESDLSFSMDKIIPIRFHEEIEIDGVKFTAYNAGHVLGAAMFLVEIDGVRILYTGDYSREEDRHLKAAEIPKCEIDILIVESTYGKNVHEPRQIREDKFKYRVHDIMKKGGKCLLPVFALGRAQELLLILNEYWKENEELKNIPIYYAGSLAQKSLSVFRTYRNMMGDMVRKKIDQGENPFHFEDNENYLEDKPLVIMATPGMLQNGLSRELFEKWCEDERNGIVFTGYSVEGTLAKQVMNKPNEIQSADKKKTLKLNMAVEVISFSAHCDFKQTSHFIKKLKPPNIILVHGDQNEMAKLKKELEIIYKDDVNVLAPKNCQTVKFNFLTYKTAKTIGEKVDLFPIFKPKKDLIEVSQDLFGFVAKEMEAEEIKMFDTKMIEMEFDNANPDEKQKKEKEEEDVVMGEFDDNFVTIEGLFINKAPDNIIIDESQLDEFTSLKRSNLVQKQYIPYKYDPEFFLRAARDLFDKVEIIHDSENTLDESDLLINIEGIKILYKQGSNLLELSWIASPKLDLITDAIGLLAIQISCNPPAVVVKEMVDHRKEQQHSKDQFKVFVRILQEHCERLNIRDENIIDIFDCNDEVIAEVDYFQKKVLCENQEIHNHIMELLEIHHHSYFRHEW